MMTHVDVFLGVAMVMLAVSLLVTMVTQAFSYVIELRGKQLRNGLGELFQTLKLAQEGKGLPLAEQILKHPLVASGIWKKLAPAISKADLKRLLQGAGTLFTLENVAAPAEVEAKAKQVEDWFDATMSRISQRFTAHTRLITAIASVVAAFALQLDAFGLVSRLYADSELRAKMAGAAAAVVTEGQEVLATPSVFTSVARDLADESKGKLPEPGSATSFQSRSDAEAWIQTNARPEVRDALVATYGDKLQKALRPAFELWLGKAAEIDKTLGSAGIRLVPDPYHPWEYPSVWSFLGVIVSAALLSLGAPFWFNALKTLSNLRPTIAANVQARDEKAKDPN